MVNTKFKEQIAKLEEQIVFYKWMAWFLVVVGGGAFAVGFLAWIWAIAPCINANGFDRPFLTKLSETGSYLQGAVGSLWALAGFMFVYVAFLGQRLQLVKQEEELEMQQENFALQQKSILLQQFESSFFQLLNLQSEIANKMHQTRQVETTNSVGVTEAQTVHEVGRHLFEDWYGLLSDCLESMDYGRNVAETNYPHAVQKESLEIKLKKTNETYGKVYEKFQGDLGHYFRTLYHVIKFVDSCELLNDTDEKKTIRNKRRYTSIVRAQLSQYELAMLFYNGISNYGKDKFKPLIERYGLLENFNDEDLVDQEHLKFYKESAFEDLDEPKT